MDLWLALFAFWTLLLEKSEYSYGSEEKILFEIPIYKPGEGGSLL